MVALHPDVAVVLGHAGLRVQEGQADAPLGAQTGVVAAALLDGILVELVAQPVGEQRQVSRPCDLPPRLGGGGVTCLISDTHD